MKGLHTSKSTPSMKHFNDHAVLPRGLLTTILT